MGMHLREHMPEGIGRLRACVLEFIDTLKS